MPSYRLVGLGAFVSAGLLLFAIVLFMIGDRRLLFTPKFVVYTRFASLSGLQVGAEVRVAGMQAGEVTEIAVPVGPGQKFRVQMQVREDLHPLVRADSVASIRTEGLVGGQFLQVGAGTEQAALVSPGSAIPSQEPFEIADLLAQASTTVKTINETIVALRVDIEDAIRTIGGTAQEADNLIQDVGKDVRDISRAATVIIADTETIVRNIKQGKGTLGQLLTDDEIYRRATSIAAEAEQTAANVRGATEQVRTTLGSINAKTGAAENTIADLRETLDKARETLSNLAENTEALKHNWFFSGFFKHRGYFNLADLSSADYLRGALEQGGRVALRVWLGSDVLFTSSRDGTLALTSDGKARLDSAVADFLTYRGSGPIVVEGYAQDGTLAERVLGSRRRAALARDYLLSRFHLTPESTGLMPLGDKSVGSPGGKKWDGVAIAMFVEKKTLRESNKSGK